MKKAMPESPKDGAMAVLKQVVRGGCGWVVWLSDGFTDPVGLQL